MTWIVIIALIAVLHITAGVQFMNHGIPDQGVAPTVPSPDCPCRSEAWNEALKQATHFPEQEYQH